MTAFPQIVSRIGHQNAEVLELLFRLIVRVIEEYPHQALWLFMSVVKSKKPERERRGRQVLEKIKVKVAFGGLVNVIYRYLPCRDHPAGWELQQLDSQISVSR